MPKGGARPGAGRKPSTLKGIAKRLPADTAALILAEINANQKWVDLANSKDERVVLETLKYLTNRAHGMPSQAITDPEGKVPTFRVLIEHIGTASNPSSTKAN